MAQNLHCPCLCHGHVFDLAHGDKFFCCKLCYPAFHMDALPREVHKASKPRKVKPTKSGYIAPEKAVTA